ERERSEHQGYFSLRKFQPSEDSNEAGCAFFWLLFFAQAKKSDSDKYKMLVINFIKKKINQ
ncbi:hypothetical protein, partial [Mannheimia haemolytica]|uniref:hypothetical protein n=1 Tax=Mannheimia haemolytica TaxID=75985 RepID=UPI000519B040